MRAAAVRSLLPVSGWVERAGWAGGGGAARTASESDGRADRVANSRRLVVHIGDLSGGHDHKMCM